MLPKPNKEKDGGSLNPKCRDGGEVISMPIPKNCWKN